MSENLDKIMELNDLVTMFFRRRHIIVLNPEEKYENKEELDNIEYDKAKWKIPSNGEFKLLIDELSQNEDLSNEEKILLIYKKICKEYIYDDNVISYIQKSDDDSFDLPDKYGRDIDEEWEKNREGHKRRVCYEVSRYLAKSLKELFKDKEDFNVCILWDKGLTHYYVGLTCDEYKLTLDVDDFNNIKDLTRLKTDLTIEGIKIFEDNENKFEKVLDEFNKGRCKDAIKNIEDKIIRKMKDGIPIEEPEDIVFLKYAIKILKEEYNIDSQGLYEYMKEIVDIKLGPQARKKVWKEITGNSHEETRYTRCLVLNVEDKKYIIDVDKMLLSTFNDNDLKKEDREFIPFNELLDKEVSNFRRRQLNSKMYNGR